jgi:microcompartment protein CcmK/EutM
VLGTVGHTQNTNEYTVHLKIRKSNFVTTDKKIASVSKDTILTFEKLLKLENIDEAQKHARIFICNNNMGNVCYENVLVENLSDDLRSLQVDKIAIKACVSGNEMNQEENISCLEGHKLILASLLENPTPDPTKQNQKNTNVRKSPAVHSQYGTGIVQGNDDYKKLSVYFCERKNDNINGNQSIDLAIPAEETTVQDKDNTTPSCKTMLNKRLESPTPQSRQVY